MNGEAALARLWPSFGWSIPCRSWLRTPPNDSIDIPTITVTLVNPLVNQLSRVGGSFLYDSRFMYLAKCRTHLSPNISTSVMVHSGRFVTTTAPTGVLAPEFQQIKLYVLCWAFVRRMSACWEYVVGPMLSHRAPMLGSCWQPSRSKNTGF